MSKLLIEINPQNYLGYHFLGYIYSVREQAGDAVAAFEKSVDISGENNVDLINLAEIHFYEKKYQKASNYAKRYLQNGGDVDKAYEIIAKVYDVVSRSLSSGDKQAMKPEILELTKVIENNDAIKSVFDPDLLNDIIKDLGENEKDVKGLLELLTQKDEETNKKA
jgi:tetratricopeptide (TPR) repeat protein